MGNKKSPIKLFCAVLQKNQIAEATDILDRQGACASNVLLGYRVRPERQASIWGIGEYDCDVILSLVPTQTANEILNMFYTTFELETKLGLAFTIPINALSRNTLNGFFDMQKETQELIKQYDLSKTKQPEYEGAVIEDKKEATEWFLKEICL